MAATRFITRSLLTLTRSSLSTTSSSSAPLRRLLPLAAAAASFRHPTTHSATTRAFSTRPTTTSLNDPNPNWSNRPPKETILLDGCDFEHWLVVVEKPEGDPTRDDIIDSYIKTLAKVVGSEEEARMKIYSVSTRHYFAFGALVSEELSYKLKELPGVRWVLPDSYLDVKNKDYGGEPFIDGQAVPYDPKYHEEWVRNNARANERNRRNDRPRNFDRSRNFERRDGGGPPQGNMAGGPPPRNMGPGGPPNYNAGPNMGGLPMGGGAPPMRPNMGGPPPMGGGAPPNMGGPPPMGGGAPPNMGGPPMRGGPPPPNMGGMPPHNMGNPPNYNAGPNMGGPPMGGGAPPNMGGMPPQGGGMRPNNMGNQPNYNAGPNMGGYPNNPQNPNYGNGPNDGGSPYQSGPNPYQNQNIPGRDYQ